MGIFGCKQFYKSLLTELKVYGYNEAPLEKMAYYAQSRFEVNKEIDDIPTWVSNSLELI